jgi:hypothetical protein
MRKGREILYRKGLTRSKANGMVYLLVVHVRCSGQSGDRTSANLQINPAGMQMQSPNSAFSE